MRTCAIIYFGIGFAACFIHPRLRAFVVDFARTKPKGAEVVYLPVLILLLSIFIAMVWPIAIFRCRKTTSRPLGDELQYLAGKAIVRGFRDIASHNACAPTAKTSDEKILEIYSKVTEAFRAAAEQRGEFIPAVFLNRIVMGFLQMYEWRFEKDGKPGLDEAIAEKCFCDHLKYEVEKYIAEGLRPDYKRGSRLF